MLTVEFDAAADARYGDDIDEEDPLLPATFFCGLHLKLDSFKGRDGDPYGVLEYISAIDSVGFGCTPDINMFGADRMALRLEFLRTLGKRFLESLLYDVCMWGGGGDHRMKERFMKHQFEAIIAALD